MLYRSVLVWISLIQSVICVRYDDNILDVWGNGLRNSTSEAYSRLTQSSDGNSFTRVETSTNYEIYRTKSSRDPSYPWTISLGSSSSSSIIRSTPWGIPSGSVRWDSHTKSSSSYSSAVSMISSRNSISYVSGSLSSSSPFHLLSPSSTFSTSSSISGLSFSPSNSAISTPSIWSDFTESSSISYGASLRPSSTTRSNSRNLESPSSSSYSSPSSTPTSSLNSDSGVVMFDDTFFSAGSSSVYSSTTSNDNILSKSAATSTTSSSKASSSPRSGPRSTPSYSPVSSVYSSSITLISASSTIIPSLSDPSKSLSSSDLQSVLTTSYQVTSTTSSSTIETFSEVNEKTSKSIKYSLVILTTRGNEYTATTVVTDSPTAGSQKSAKYADVDYWESPGKIAGTFVPVGLVCLLIVLFLIWVIFLNPKRKQRRFDTFYSSNIYSPSSTNSSPSILQSKHSSFSGLSYADEKCVVNPRTLSRQPSLENPFELPKPVIVDQRLDFHEMLNNIDNSSSKVSFSDDVDYSRKVLHVGDE